MAKKNREKPISDRRHGGGLKHPVCNECSEELVKKPHNWHCENKDCPGYEMGDRDREGDHLLQEVKYCTVCKKNTMEWVGATFGQWECEVCDAGSESMEDFNDEAGHWMLDDDDDDDDDD